MTHVSPDISHGYTPLEPDQLAALNNAGVPQELAARSGIDPDSVEVTDVYLGRLPRDASPSASDAYKI